nr:MAG TPA: hypothetical protein [Bacteriophage sp.]
MISGFINVRLCVCACYRRVGIGQPGAAGG